MDFKPSESSLEQTHRENIPNQTMNINQVTFNETIPEFKEKNSHSLTSPECTNKEKIIQKDQVFRDSSSNSFGSLHSVTLSSKSSEKELPSLPNFTAPALEKENQKKLLLGMEKESLTENKNLQCENELEIYLSNEKGDEWIKDYLIIEEKRVIKNANECMSNFSKIKIMSDIILGRQHKIKVTCPSKIIIFAVNGGSLGTKELPISYYVFAKFIQDKLVSDGIKLKESNPEKLEGFSDSVENSYICGKILKKSQIVGKWEERFVVINSKGIFSYKKPNENHSMFIANGSIKEIWTRFEIHEHFIVIKIRHNGSKTEFGFPLTKFLSADNWLYNFFCMMHKGR